MVGKRVLLAAEFPRGGATLSRLLPLAGALAHRGHDVTVAVSAEQLAAASAAGFAVLEAPCYRAPPPPGFVALSYADLLMHGGYAAPDALRDLMAGWRRVFDQTTPDLLVADFAPTAMLMARAGAIPMAAIGDGFSLPPLAAPLPDMRPWASAKPEAIVSVEGRVLAVVNARLGRLGVKELRHLRDLFADVPLFLCTFPELDHYPTRPDGAWFGEVFAASSQGAPATWPAGQGERIYVELDPRHPALLGVIDALDRLRLPALVQAAGMPVRQADALERPSVQVTTTTNRTSLVGGCDLVICQGHETVVTALLAGKPVLMLPVFVEQMMTLHRVAGQGLGHGIDPDADAAAIDAGIRRLIDDRASRLRAANFARAYAGYHPSLAVDPIADEIHEHLSA